MQINRLFGILYTLLNKKTVTASKLAEQFEVSTRTIYRDIDCLSSVGIPIFMRKGKGGGISLLENFILNKMLLTDVEQEDILSSLKALHALPMSENSTAFMKLCALFGQANTDWLEIDFSSWRNGVQQKDLFETIKSAILSRNVLTFSYFSSKGEHTERAIEPLKLCFKGQSWYVYGYCKHKQDYRFFKLSRIKNCMITEERSSKPIVDHIFRDYQYTDPNDSIKLKLKLSAKMAFRVYEEFEQIETTPDGNFIVTIDFPKSDWLYSYILSFGEACTVLEPDKVRETMQEKLQQVQKNYGI